MDGPIPSRGGSVGTGARVRWGRALSWGFYDFANTIYSGVVATAAIVVHVEDLTGRKMPAYLAIAGSLALCGVCLPFAGELADRTGRSKRYLVILTLVTCAMCMGMSLTSGAGLVLVLFCVANFCYEASLTFYDNLLPTVAPPDRVGFISGVGVGLGYLGVAFALPIAYFVVRWYGATGAAHELKPLFAVAGVLFLLFSLPLFLFVPEKPATRRPGSGVRLSSLVWRRVMVTVRGLPRHRPVLLFLVGNFLCVDSLNTGVFTCVPYMVGVFGLEKSKALLWLVPFSVAAFALGALGGRLADVFGPRRTFLSACACVFVTIGVTVWTTSFAVFIGTFIVLGGYGLSTIWAAGRKMLIALVPPGQLGKYFGLYNVGRKFSLIGLLAFGVLSDLELPDLTILGHVLDKMGYRLGMAFQSLLLIVGTWCIWRVKMDNGHRS